MRRRLVTLAVLGLFAACGFPEVTYETDDGGGDAGTQDVQVGSDGSGNQDGPVDGTTGGDGASSGGDAFDEEAATGTDAANDGSDSSPADTGTDGAVTDGAVNDGDAMSDAAVDVATEASGEAGDASTADAPNDVAEEPAPDSGPDATSCDKDGDHDLAKGGVCGSTDCDDNDARAYFGEPSFLTFAPTPVTMGDWNCDGVVTPQFTTGFSCGVLSLGSCGTASGFTDTPACGATSPNFITCKVSTAVLCVTATTTSNTQGCK